MKTRLAFSVAGLLLSGSLLAQTNRHNNLGPEQFLWKMKRISSTEFIAVGNAGAVLKYNTGCNDWLPLNVSNTGDDFRNLSFPTANTGYISGPANAFYKTTNGGTSWSYITPATTGLTNASIQCVHFISTDTGFITGSQVGVSGGGRFIKRTTNGGTTWTDVTPATISTSTVYDMAFFQPGIGIAVATNNKAFRTTDNGLSWTAVTTPGTAYAVSVAGTQNAIAVANGNIMRSTDQGQTWTSIATTVTGLQGVSFYDTNNGMITGNNGAVLHTSDGGITWNAIPTLLSQKVYDVVMTGTEKGIAVGANGIVFDLDKSQTFHRLFEERFCNPTDSITYAKYTNADLTANNNPRKWFFENVNEDENGLEASGWFPGKFAIYDAYYYEAVLNQHAADSAYIATRTLNFSGTNNLSLQWNEAFYTHVNFLSTTKIEGFNGTNWITLYTNKGLNYGDGIASAIFPTHKRSIDISALAGVSNAKLRFHYIAPNTADGLKNFWAISDIEVRNQVTDLAVDSLTAAGSGSCLPIQPLDVAIHISNVGELSVFPLEFGWSSSDGQAGHNAAYEAITPNSNFNMTLIQGFIPPSNGGIITIKAWISNTPDHNYMNDTFSMNLTFVPGGNGNSSLGNDTSLCPGSTLALQTPPGATNVVWSDGSGNHTLSINQAGQYYFSGTLSGCPVADTINVVYFPVITPDIIADGNDLKVAQNNYSSIEWFKNGVQVNTASGLYTLTNAETGDYTVQVTTNDGCTVTSDVYNYTPTNIGVPNSIKNKLAVYPNPAHDQITLDFGKVPDQFAVLTIFDGTGKMIAMQKLNSGDQKQAVNIAALPEGIYLIKVNSGNSVYSATFTRLK
ncbi:MAG: T9SS type A sorting domain-containing protein [Sphingobacteriales bacterium]|nr:MAG: T9SS type A sorting domain-containing protein [Sphingobacteriales bacterium]